MTAVVSTAAGAGQLTADTAAVIRLARHKILSVTLRSVHTQKILTVNKCTKLMQ